MSIPIGASGWKQPLCVTPTPPEAGILEATAFCHQLGHKPRSQQVLILGCEALHTNRGAMTQQDFLLLETWDLPLVVPYGAFGVMAMQLKIEFT